MNMMIERNQAAKPAFQRSSDNSRPRNLATCAALLLIVGGLIGTSLGASKASAADAWTQPPVRADFAPRQCGEQIWNHGKVQADQDLVAVCVGALLDGSSRDGVQLIFADGSSKLFHFDRVATFLIYRRSGIYQNVYQLFNVAGEQLSVMAMVSRAQIWLNARGRLAERDFYVPDFRALPAR